MDQIEEEEGTKNASNNLDLAVEAIPTDLHTINLLVNSKKVSCWMVPAYDMTWDEVKDLEEIVEIETELKARERARQEVQNKQS